MSKKKDKTINLNVIDYILLISPLLYGVLPIWSCALLGITCTCGLIYKFSKEKRLMLPKGPKIYLLIIYLLSFLVTEFFAIDKGMNILAFIKNIPILLFIILLYQFDESEDDKNRHMYMISISSASSVIISALLMLVPSLNVYSKARFHGLFYYANSYGLFLLIGVLCLLFKKDKKWYDYLMFAILFVGIVLTNSRAIIIMTILLLITSSFFNRKQLKSSIILTTSFVLLFVGAYFIFNMEKRVSTKMLGSSEFVSRIIYYQDALKEIAKHPLGLGYHGFWYEQAKNQTAIYDTVFVHSSILQVILDVGIVPALSLFIMLAMVFFDKKQTAFSRIIIIAILGHSVIDIDLEYLYFILIISLFIYCDTIAISNKKIINPVLGILTVIFMWIFLGDALNYAKSYNSAVNVIPFHTEALQEVLYSETSKENQTLYANKILKLNKNVSGAYEALRNNALEKSNYDDAIKYEKERLLLNKYKIQNYMQYASLLSEAVSYYNNPKTFSKEKLTYCLNEIINIEPTIKDVLENTNPLCYKTIHTPELDIPDNLQQFIDGSKEALKKVEE